MHPEHEMASVPTGSAVLRLTRKTAAEVLKRRARLLRVLQQAGKKLVRHEGALSHVVEDLRTMIRLAYAWGHRAYPSIPWRSLLYVVAALLYFLNPVDLIPDALAGVGFVDDMAVIGAVVRAIRLDLDAFRQWESEREAASLPASAPTLPVPQQDRPPRQSYSISR